MTDNSANVEPSARPKGQSLADLVAAPEAPAVQYPFGVGTWVKIAVLAGLLVAMNWDSLTLLVQQCHRDSNWQHGFIIPLFSLYLLFVRRQELLAAPRRVCVWGLPVVILGILLIMAAVYPIKNLWLRQLSILPVAFGLVLYLAGPKVAKLTWLPIFYFAFAMPIPDVIYGQIATPLQETAAKGAVWLLRLFGAHIDIQASSMWVTSVTGDRHRLEVAEACSGLRSLLAYLALGVAWAYLENRPLWQRVILVVAAIPVAILCNILRVAITCMAFWFDRPAFGEKFMHEFTGLLMLFPALLILWGISAFLNGIFVEVEDEDDGKPSSAGGSASPEAPKT